MFVFEATVGAAGGTHCIKFKHVPNKYFFHTLRHMHWQVYLIKWSVNVYVLLHMNKSVMQKLHILIK